MKAFLGYYPIEAIANNSHKLALLDLRLHYGVIQC